MSSVEDRVHAAMSAAADANLAAREIQSAPPLRLPPRPVAGGRRRQARRLAGTRQGHPERRRGSPGTNRLSGPGRPTGPGGVPRYYVASGESNHLVAGDSVTGKLLANLTFPVRKGSTSFVMGITAADDDRTFAVSVVTYTAAALQGRNALVKATGTASWYEVRLAPGTATPARLTALPVKPQTVHGGTALMAVAAALSGSGTALAVTTVTASGGLAAQVFSVATGQLLHDWTSNEPPVGQPSLTWTDRDRELAVETSSVSVAGTRGTDTVRELSVSGPVSGDLLADGKIVWNVQLGQRTPSLLQACTEPPGQLGTEYHLISADGTAFGCSAITGPVADQNLSFLTDPLASGTAVTPKATIDYQIKNMAKTGVSEQHILWISPSGDAVVGAWALAAPGTYVDEPNGLHVGVMSHGKFTPLRFPPGFDQQAVITTITF